eukprot:m.519702 g.519702  ORF g.519702 m.519702 type:complete len:61 (+) comp21948_c0_seq5:90-272(+)
MMPCCIASMCVVLECGRVGRLRHTARLNSSHDVWAGFVCRGGVSGGGVGVTGEGRGEGRG